MKKKVQQRNIAKSTPRDSVRRSYNLGFAAGFSLGAACFSLLAILLNYAY